MRDFKFYFVLVAFIIIGNFQNLQASNFDNNDPIKLVRQKYRLYLHTTSKITFTKNSNTLSSGATYDLNKIVRILKNNPKLKIEIGVHSDSRTYADEAIRITTERANTIKNYLLKYGVNEASLVTKGYGFTRLLNNCDVLVKCSSKEHNINKRIEFKVINPEALDKYVILKPKNKKTLIASR